MPADDAMDEFERVQDRLTKARPTLSPTLSRAAAYLLEKPADVVTMSMREIARESDIPAPNFSRLARQIGFAGYSGLRAVYRRRIQSGMSVAGSTPDRLRPPVDPSRGSEELWTAFKEAALRNVAATFENVDSASIAFVAEELRSRDHIYVAATHTSHQLIRYLHFIGSMATPSFRLVGQDGGNFGNDLVDIGERDALICLSSTPSPEAAVEAARLARTCGALVIGITESRITPLAAVSDRLLLAPAESPSFFQSKVSALAIIEMLVGFLAMEAGEAAQDRIQRIQAERQRFGQS